MSEELINVSTALERWLTDIVGHSNTFGSVYLTVGPSDLPQDRTPQPSLPFS